MFAHLWAGNLRPTTTDDKSVYRSLNAECSYLYVTVWLNVNILIIHDITHVSGGFSVVPIPGDHVHVLNLGTATSLIRVLLGISRTLMTTSV